MTSTGEPQTPQSSLGLSTAYNPLPTTMSHSHRQNVSFKAGPPSLPNRRTRLRL
jgi:hypothetical protein